MRPGRTEDRAAFIRLLTREAVEGRRETVPGRWMERALAAIDWEACSRVAGDPGSELDGAVVVTNRAYAIGVITRVEVAVASAGDVTLRHRLVEWGIAFSRAAGAAAAQIWVPHGRGDGLADLGLVNVRPWWRMDRSLGAEPPAAEPVAGYELRVGAEVARGVWSDVHNRSFEDHWRYSIRGEEELMNGRDPALCLLAVDASGRPAAITLGQIETYGRDTRAQPVGIVGSVGTLPAHRRRGIARWLVAEILGRLHRSGARSSSLYVDGMNPTGAPALYRSFGFEVAFVTEVWEALFP
ncbi:MAG TPA: GNAT family N-acetyltransferase [Candidatus Dormibacteraeota bacterium]|nr:GNAT family N-acetyltransferase [Candidatus Dormibacteraeota bacterium]